MSLKITIPMPLLVSIEDVGWWKGADGSGVHQPFRTGMPRDHVPEDYAAVAALGKKLDMKILAGFVLCEWDRDNILKDLPSSTWMGQNWTSPHRDMEQKERAARIIKNAKNFMEIGMHGLGHEYWDQGVMKRSEFHDPDGIMRDPDDIRRHISFFFRIMEQHGFDTKLKTFIPPALMHSFGDSDKGFQTILHEFGIEHVTLMFKKAKQYSSPQTGKIAWENHVLLVERGESPIVWNRTAAEPEFEFDRPVLALHWANILHPDPGKNLSVIEKWADYIKTGSKKTGVLLSKDSDSCFVQYCHCTMTKIIKTNDGILLDAGWMDRVPSGLLKNPIYIKADTPEGVELRISGAEQQPCQRTAEKQYLRLVVTGQDRKIFIRNLQHRKF